MSISFSQEEADSLLALEKHYFGNETLIFPKQGQSLRVPVISADGNEEFVLDITRSHIVLHKTSFQIRARTIVVLARVDIGSASHRNPDGGVVACPHLHLYREGFEDRWAKLAPKECFSNDTDPLLTLEEFMNYCNIKTKPKIKMV